MPRKTVCAKDVTELEIKFNDDKSLLLRFDMQALLYFSELEGGMTGFVKGISLPTMCAKIIFVGAKSLNADFTFEEAYKITSGLSPSTITEIVNEFNESMGTLENEVQNEAQKKLMAQFLNSIMK